MIPELGHFSLILALVLSLVQAVVPMVGANRNRIALMAVGRPAAQGQFLFIAFAFGCLTWSFITSDFSLQLAAVNSHTDTPLIYKITGVWGNHEGSLLLWALALSLWTVAVTVFDSDSPPMTRPSAAMPRSSAEKNAVDSRRSRLTSLGIVTLTPGTVSWIRRATASGSSPVRHATAAPELRSARVSPPAPKS